MAGPVNAIQPDQSLSFMNWNCIGAGEEPPPRVYRSVSPVPVPAPAPVHVPGQLLRGKANTLNVSSGRLEVTSRPRAGHAAMPTPNPHAVLRAGRCSAVSTVEMVTPMSRGFCTQPEMWKKSINSFFCSHL